jgi:hypothetical protein
MYTHTHTNTHTHTKAYGYCFFAAINPHFFISGHGPTLPKPLETL